MLIFGVTLDCDQKVDTQLFERDSEKMPFSDMATIEGQIVRLGRSSQEMGEDVAGSRGSEPGCHQELLIGSSPSLEARGTECSRGRVGGV
jgi:hypothetical protein